MDTDDAFVKIIKGVFPECEIEIFPICLDSEDFEEGDRDVPRKKGM